MTTNSVPGIAYPQDLAGLAADLNSLGVVPLGKKLPYILAQTGVPVGLVSNGTVATNGIITLGTALPTTYSGGIWLRLPAGAVVDGAAGLYWAVMSSTTQGQVYTAFVDTASAFTPYIPTGLVAAVGSNAAYTQTTGADVTLSNVPLTGSSLGLNGGLASAMLISTPNNGNNKLVKAMLGSGMYGAFTVTTNQAIRAFPEVRNRGSATAQVTSYYTGYSGGALQWISVNTAADLQIVIAGNLATATDYVVIESFNHQIFPS